MAKSSFYKKMLDNLYDGVYFVDLNRKITFWNKGAERISGFSATEVLGSNCFDNILNHIDGHGKYLCKDGCPLHATIVDGETRETEVYLHHKDGYRVPVFVRTLPYYVDDVIVGAVEIFVDNSERMEIISNIKKLEELAMTDELSGLPNRRYTNEYLISKLNEYHSLGIDFAVVFFDLDDFKEVNDTYGHDIGDEVIKMTARTCVNTLRKSDLIARWGGEEFVSILFGVDQKEIEMITEKMRFLIESSRLRVNNKNIKVTVSIGATQVTPDDSVESLIQRADQLMYQSKKTGKNKVTIG